MSSNKKNMDRYGTWRCIAVGIFISTEEYNTICRNAAAEKKSLATYMCSCLENKKVEVFKKESAYSVLQPFMDVIRKEMDRIGCTWSRENEIKDEIEGN